MAPLLYRFGFVCLAADEDPPAEQIWRSITSGWTRIEVDGLVFRVHPETSIEVYKSAEGVALLAGNAFTQGPRDVAATARLLLQSSSDDAVYELLDDLSGRFALFLLKGEDQRVFNDPIGARSIFYRHHGGLCIASHAQLAALTFGDPRRDDVMKLMREDDYQGRTVRYLPGDWTVYENIYAQAPNNYYDIQRRKTTRYWPRTSRRTTTLRDFVAEADRYFDAFTAFLNGRFNPVLGVTGGIDTRGLMAAFSRRGLCFDGVTWRGPFLAAEEVEIVKELSARVPGGYNVIEFGSLRSSLPEIAKKNAGLYSTPSRLTAHMSLTARERSAFIRGYGGEVMRGFYNLYRSQRIHEFEPKAFAKAYIKGDIEGYYGQKAVEASEEFLERANYGGVSAFGFDPSDLFYWEHRMGMWGAGMHNEMDAAMYSMTGYNSRPLFEVSFGLKEDERLTKQLIQGLVERYDPAIAAIPFT